MIAPFTDKQIKNGTISYGLSSYGYDIRVADEYKIFTNVNNSVVDPKNFDENSFVVQLNVILLEPAVWFWLNKTGGVVSNPPPAVVDTVPV